MSISREEASVRHSLIKARLLTGKVRSPKEFRELKERLKLSPVEEAEANAMLAEMELRWNNSSMDRKVRDIVPEGWFKKYLSYSYVLETPDLFNFLLSLALFSHRVGRNAFFFLGGKVLYPAVSVFLSSPAGAGRRGDAVSHMLRVANRTKARISSDRITPEIMLEEIAKHKTLIHVAEEASLLLSKKDYMQDTAQQLCRVIDGDDQIGVGGQTRKYKIRARGTTFTLIATCAPSLFRDMPTTALTGGLMSRVLLGYSEGAERHHPFPEDIASQNQVERAAAQLAWELERITQVKRGKLTYRGSAKRYYEAWYSDKERIKRREDPKLASWYERKPAHLHRIVMSFLVAEPGQGMSASIDVLDRAIAILNLIEENMRFLFKYTTDSWTDRLSTHVTDTIKKRGNFISRRELFRSTYRIFKNIRQFDEHMELLIEAQMVKKVEEISKKGRKITYYTIPDN